MSWELWPELDQIETREQEHIVFETLALALACGMPYPDNWPKKEREDRRVLSPYLRSVLEVKNLVKRALELLVDHGGDSEHSSKGTKKRSVSSELSGKSESGGG